MAWTSRFMAPAVLGLAILASCSPRVDAQKGPKGGGRPSPAAGAGRPGPAPIFGTPYPGNPPIYRNYQAARPYFPSGAYYNYLPYRYPLYPNYIYFPSYTYRYVAPSYDYPYYPSVSEFRLYNPAPAVMPAEPVNQPAYVEVRLPTADAQVLLNGNQTTSVGTQRVFTTPVLEPGEYAYEISATWKQDSQDVRVVRTIRIVPGRTTLVDFTKVNTADK